MSQNKHIEDFSTHVERKIFSKTCKDSADGSGTPAKYMTGNLLKTENGNNEEQQHIPVQIYTLHGSNYCSPPISTHRTMSNDSLAEEKLQSAIKLTQHCFARPDEVHL